MKYLLMCCINEDQWANLPDADRVSVMKDYGQLVHELKVSGRLLAGAMLDQTARAVTISKKNGEAIITDGPFAETKEQLGGYHVVECRDRDEAISIALRIPSLAAGGLIEVRPILQSE